MHKRQQQKTFDQQKTVEPVSYTSALSLSVCVFVEVKGLKTV